MACNSSWYLFCSGLLEAGNGLALAIENAPDRVVREGLERAEAEVQSALRAEHVPGPEQRRVWLREDLSR